MLQRRSTILAAVVAGCLSMKVLAAEPAKAPQATGTKAPLSINIDNPSFRKLVMAIPTFRTLPGAASEQTTQAKEASEELGRLLKFSGLFNIMDPAAYDQLQQKPAAVAQGAKPGLDGVELPQWKALGVEGLTIGELSSEPTGLVLALRTIDINRGELLLGKRYTHIYKADLPQVLKRYADLLLKAYTGKPGIFSTKLVFIGRKTKASTKQVFVSDFDGSHAVAITSENAPHLSPAWSPDGRYISYTSYENGNPDLFTYDTVTKRKKKLSSHKGINSGSNWAPNGKIIAFSGSVAGDTDIYTVLPEGSERKPLIRGSDLDVDPRFSPNGQWIAYVSGRYGNPHIFRLAVHWDTATSPRVTDDKRLTYAGWYNATPAWSPDSDKIAFGGYDKDTKRWDLFMMNPDGTTMERLTIHTGDNESPSWSPNGQLLVFQSNRVDGHDEKGEAQLWVMNRDGTNQRQLNTGLYDAQTPSWGPAPKE